MLKRAYSTIELLLAISILVLGCSLVIPMIGNASKSSLNDAKRLLVSDIELAQSMAIAHPEDGIILVIQEDGWHIALKDTPYDPIKNELNGEPIQTRCGVGPAISAQHVKIDTNVSEHIIPFNHHGGIDLYSGLAEVTLSLDSQTELVTIHPTTGWIE
ncbi:MAG: type II secretion system GspH family protein [Phycisphaerales bacterium]|nr:type II secretion system GspH family protein [Phycisphaerales bacterium]